MLYHILLLREQHTVSASTATGILSVHAIFVHDAVMRLQHTAHTTYKRNCQCSGRLKYQLISAQRTAVTCSNGPVSLSLSSATFCGLDLYLSLFTAAFAAASRCGLPTVALAALLALLALLLLFTVLAAGCCVIRYTGTAGASPSCSSQAYSSTHTALQLSVNECKLSKTNHCHCSSPAQINTLRTHVKHCTFAVQSHNIQFLKTQLGCYNTSSTTSRIRSAPVWT
jgi:hypothetical protein